MTLFTDAGKILPLPMYTYMISGIVLHQPSEVGVKYWQGNQTSYPELFYTENNLVIPAQFSNFLLHRYYSDFWLRAKEQHLKPNSDN